MSNRLLNVQEVSMRFGGLLAVSSASLHVNEGEIVSLIGPNGAGKTTLFSIISGFLKPTQGSVHFGGERITDLAPHSICQAGLVRTFQVVKPFVNLSVQENIAVGAHTRISKRKDAHDKAAEVAERVGMGAMLEQSAGGLTVAGRKRLELARALATDPKILLLDEVMAGLNATEITEIVEVIRTIRDSGVTVLLIEHVMQAVMSLSDRAYVLNNGAIIANGTPQEITSMPEVIEAYLGQGAASRIASAGGKHA